MAISYKRMNIQIPLQDIESFENYAKKYSLSVSGAIIFLAKKSLEQEEIIKQLPDMIKIIQEEQKNISRTKNKAPKKQKK